MADASPVRLPRTSRASSAGQAALHQADRALRVAEPTLRIAGRVLRALGTVVRVLAATGVAGVALMAVGAVADGGWSGLLVLVLLLVPVHAWRVGGRAVRGAGLLADPRRVGSAVEGSGQAGRAWLDRLAQLGQATRARRATGVARHAVGAGRSLWAMVGPHVEGASDLRDLAMWPRTASGLACAAASPVLLLVGLVWAAISLLA